ncbi:hypothetical protein RQP46_010482 [Phenoliferia psychrophenolica]
MVDGVVQSQDRGSWSSVGPKLGPLLNLEPIRWQVITFMRYSKPCRIGDAVVHCQKSIELDIVLREPTKWNIELSREQLRTHSHPDSVLYIHAGVALDWSGTDDLSCAETYLKVGLRRAGNLGPLDSIWGRGALSRVLRKQGKVIEADKVEDEILNYIQSRPGYYSPPILRKCLLGPGEETNSVLARLQVPLCRVFGDRHSALAEAAHGTLIQHKTL